MEFNLVTTGIELIGTTVKKLHIDNNIVDVERDGKRSFGLNINEPEIEKLDNSLFAQLQIEIVVEVEQKDGQMCKIELSLEGAFISGKKEKIDDFRQLVAINGAAAILGIARGKIETISASVFNCGKIVIPFVNVIDYYKNQE